MKVTKKRIVELKCCNFLIIEKNTQFVRIVTKSVEFVFLEVPLDGVGSRM